MRASHSASDERGSINAHLNCAVVAVALTVVGIASVLYIKPTFSAIEKRELTKFPVFSYQALMSEQYTQGLSDYFADTFLAREYLVSLSGSLKQWSGVAFDEIRAHTQTAPIGQGGNAAQGNTIPPLDNNSNEAAPPASSEAPPAAQEEEAVRNGAIYVYKGRGFQAFGGNDAVGKRYTDAINRYADAIGDTVRIHSLVVPSPIGFGMPQKYQDITTPELPKIQQLYSDLRPEVNAVNVYDAFERHKDEYIFFGTDHHWTALGAYYAYVEFCNSLGLVPVDIRQLEKKTLYNFLGTLYAQTQDASMLANPDHVDYYTMPGNITVTQYRIGEPFTPYKTSLYGEYARPINSYSVFLHGDLPLTVIDTQQKNGRRIVLVKESYGNAFAPFLVNNFEQVLVVDERYLEVGLLDIIRQYQATDLLFINNIFSCYSPYHINKIQTIMNQVYVPPPPPEEEEETQQPVDTAQSIYMFE